MVCTEPCMPAPNNVVRWVPAWVTVGKRTLTNFLCFVQIITMFFHVNACINSLGCTFIIIFALGLLQVLDLLLYNSFSYWKFWTFFPDWICFVFFVCFFLGGGAQAPFALPLVTGLNLVSPCSLDKSENRKPSLAQCEATSGEQHRKQ